MIKEDKRIVLMLVVVSLIATGAFTLTPDIKYKTVTKVEFAGAMGRAMNFVSKLGRGSSDVTGAVYLKGNKMLQGDEEQGTLIDLDAERMVMLNHKKKTYTAISFADFRQKMEEVSSQIAEASQEASEEASEEASQEASQEASEENGPTATEEPATEFKFDFQINPTGETSTVNGHRAERFQMTMLMEAQSTEKSPEGEQEQQGTIVIASDLWMSEDIAGHDEIADFHRRFAERFGDEVLGGAEMQNMAGALQQAFAGDPRIRTGMEKMQAEAAKMKGVDVKNVTHVVLVAPDETFNPDLVFKVEAKEEKKPKRGLGGFAKRLAQQAAGVEDSGDEKAQEEAKTQHTLLTTTTEMQEYSTDNLSASLFEIPSDYREVSFENQ